MALWIGTSGWQYDDWRSVLYAAGLPQRLDRAEGLGDRLGPFLLQLPPNLRGDPERLDACLAAFPRTARVAVEPRHESWWTDEVRAVLARRNAALCWADRRGPITPTWVTADWGYVRLHEGRVFFNNDHGGAAVRNVDTFSHLE